MKNGQLRLLICVLISLSFHGAVAQEDELNLDTEISNMDSSSATTEDLSLPEEPLNSAEAPPSTTSAEGSEFQDEFSLDSNNAESSVPQEQVSPESNVTNTDKADPLSTEEKQEQTPPPVQAKEKEAPAPVVPSEEAPPPPVVTEVPVPEPSKPTVKPKPILASDDPDLDKEKRFHEIYQKYNQEPTSMENWDKATSGRDSNAYQVQKGDTLWDLSKTLFGDPNYWPKIWSLNKQNIYNPHEINPQLVVQFYPGSLNQPPTLGVTDKSQMVATSSETDAAMAVMGKTTSGNAAAATTAQQKALNAVSNAPKARTLIPVLKEIPPSLPAFKVRAVVDRTSKVEIESRPPQLLNPLIPLSTYLIEDDLPEAGKIKETEMGLDSAYEYQYIFVEIQGNVQKNYTVVKERKGPAELSSSIKQIEIQGEIEVLDRVNGDDPYYRAIVKKSLTRVEVGSKLIPGSIPRVDVAKTTPDTTGLAELVGGQFGEGNNLYGLNTYVFLNKGSAQGIKSGQTLPVYQNSKIRRSTGTVQINESLVGYVKVVQVNAESATAYVIEVFDDIRIGDYVGAKWAGSASINFNTNNNASDSETLEVDDAPPIAPADAEPAAQPESSDSSAEDELAL